MTPQELKNSILQLAIQGKLVEQRAEEGTAAELLEKIFAAKNAKSAKKNSRAETQRRRGKTPDLIEIAEGKASFEIPESWEWAELGVCCEMYTGNSISEVEKRTKYEGRKEGLDYIGTKDVSFQQTICYNNGVKIPFDKEVDFRKARAGAILLCIEGGSAGKKIAILDRDVCFGNKLCMFMPRTLLNTYLFFFLQSMEFRKVFSENMTGIIGGVSIKKLKEIMVPIPPLAEQKRIVAKIEELLPLIDRYEKAWSKLEDFNKRFPVDMQKSLLQMAIHGKLVDHRPEEGTGEELYRQIQAEKQRLVKSGKIKKEKPLPAITEDEIPFDIPDSWKWVRLGQLGNTNIGLTYGPKDVCDEGVVVLRSSNIQNGKMDYADIVKVSCSIPESKMCHVGDILICARNGSKRLVGKAALIDRDGMSFGAFMAIFRSCCNAYVLYVINSAYFRNALLGDTGTTTINQITQDVMKNMLIPLPPLAEQKRIVAKLEELLPLCERLK